MQKYFFIAACTFSAYCYTMDKEKFEIEELKKRVAFLERTVQLMQKNNASTPTKESTARGYEVLDSAAKKQFATPTQAPAQKSSYYFPHKKQSNELLPFSWDTSESGDEN